MSMNPIRTALISGAPGEREYLRAQFINYPGIRVVYEGQNLSTHFKKLKAAAPGVIVVTEGTVNNFINELTPALQRTRAKLPGTNIIVRTLLDPQHPFVEQSYDAGISIVGTNVDIQRLVDGINRVSQGERVELFMPRTYDLETNQSPRHRETR